MTLRAPCQVAGLEQAAAEAAQEAASVKMFAADHVPAGAAAALRGGQDLRALSEDETLSLHELACLYAGRELTQDEARALLSKH